MIATLGVILSAVYLLGLVRRVLFGPVTKPGNAGLADLGPREMAILAPLVLLVFWIGFYPDPLLSVMHASVDHLVAQVGAAAPMQLSEVRPLP